MCFRLKHESGHDDRVLTKRNVGAGCFIEEASLAYVHKGYKVMRCLLASNRTSLGNGDVVALRLWIWFVKQVFRFAPPTKPH